jgi:hypothetical protein
VDAVNNDIFERIFARVVKERRLSFDPDAATFFRTLCLEMGGELRACQPADVLNTLVSISEFEGTEPQINPESLKRAAGLYFAKPRGMRNSDFRR